MNIPKISIIIPTFNRANFVKQAIASALAQNDSNMEIIISDNASTDETWETVKAFQGDARVKCFRNEANSGMVNNWHRCVYDYCTGDWFLVLSDDDVLMVPDFLKQVRLFIEQDSELGFVVANGWVLNTNKGHLDRTFIPLSGLVPGAKLFALHGSILSQSFTLCSVVFNRNKAIEAACFSDPENICCDEELYLQLALRHRVAVISEPMTLYRVHTGNLSHGICTNVQVVFEGMKNLLGAYEAAKVLVSKADCQAFETNTQLWATLHRRLLAIEQQPHWVEYEQRLIQLFPEAMPKIRQTKALKWRYYAMRLRMKVLHYLRQPIAALAWRFTKSNQNLTFS